VTLPGSRSRNRGNVPSIQSGSMPSRHRDTLETSLFLRK
jgi:hypothetical protein